MDNRNIGELIRKLREKHHYSQEVLAEGICDPSTLSRIENGMQQPNIRNYRLLMERLGEKEWMDHPTLNADEYQAEALRREIYDDIAFHQFERLDEKIRRFRHLCRTEEACEQSFGCMMLFWEDSLQQKEARKFPPASWDMTFRSECLRLLHLTFSRYSVISRFSTNSFSSPLPLTTTESVLINGIGISYYREKNYEDALRHFLFLSASFKAHRHSYPTYTERLRECAIRNNIAMTLLELSRPEDALSQFGKVFEQLTFAGGQLVFLIFLRNRSRIYYRISQTDAYRLDLALIRSLYPQLPAAVRRRISFNALMTGDSLLFCY